MSEMRQPDPQDAQQQDSQRQDSQQLRAALRVGEGARAQVVNRAHRVVRERAVTMREQRRVKRSLWIPLLICSSLLMVVCYAVWGMLADYDLIPTSIPDSSDQLFVFLLWSLPVTAFVLLLVWIRRERSRANGEVRR